MANLNNPKAALWETTNQLRSNSKLTASEYSMPVLGLIFLRHATNRFMKVKAEIEPTFPTCGGERAPLKPDHFKGKAAIFLPKGAQYDYHVDLPEDQDVGQAILDAMKLIEGQVEILQGSLPEEYLAIFDLICEKKNNLSTQTRNKVKVVAKDLIETIKTELSKVDNWREKEATQAQVCSFFLQLPLLRYNRPARRCLHPRRC